ISETGRGPDGGALGFPSSNVRAALERCLRSVRHGRSACGGAAARTAGPGTEGAEAAEAPVVLIQTTEDACRTWLQAPELLRRPERHSVVPFLLERAVCWARLSMPELLAQLIPDPAPRQEYFESVGIAGPAPTLPGVPFNAMNPNGGGNHAPTR